MLATYYPILELFQLFCIFHNSHWHTWRSKFTQFEELLCQNSTNPGFKSSMFLVHQDLSAARFNCTRIQTYQNSNVLGFKKAKKHLKFYSRQGKLKFFTLILTQIVFFIKCNNLKPNNRQIERMSWFLFIIFYNINISSW